MRIPTELSGDLAGWRFMTVYKVDKPCAHGACCETYGIYADRARAEAAVRKLFRRSDDIGYRSYIDDITILTKDGKTGYRMGSDVLREVVTVLRPRIRARPPKKPRLRLV